MSVINDYTGSPTIDAILEAIDYASDVFHDSKLWNDRFGDSTPAENIERLAKAAAAEIARLRELGLEACDLAASYADDAREYGAPSPRIDEIRKELTR